MVGQIEALVDEIAGLRAENDSLRTELREAVAMFGRASDALGGAAVPTTGRRRSRARGAVQVPAESGGPGRGRGGRRGARTRRRATPESVTTEVVRAAIGKLGQATAAEVAAEISRAGAPVSGRALRHLAEKAGARVVVGPDGRRLYSL